MKKIKITAALLAVAFIIGSAFTSKAPIAMYGFEERQDFDQTYYEYIVYDLNLVEGEDCIAGSKVCQVNMDLPGVTPLNDPDGAGPLKAFKVQRSNAPAITGSQQFVFEE